MNAYLEHAKETYVRLWKKSVPERTDELYEQLATSHYVHPAADDLYFVLCDESLSAYFKVNGCHCSIDVYFEYDDADPNFAVASVRKDGDIYVFAKDTMAEIDAEIDSFFCVGSVKTLRFWFKKTANLAKNHLFYEKHLTVCKK